MRSSSGMSEKPTVLARPLLSATFLTTRTLAAQGLTRRRMREQVAQGRLIRVRRGRFVPGGTPAALVRTGRLGGRLDCVSLLTACGVFVRERHGLHVQFERGSSRLPPREPDITPHWRASNTAPARLASDIVDALIQACRCQSPRDALATLDSAWHHRLIDETDVAEVFARLPSRFRRLRGLLDRRAESGPETLMRLMLRALGCHVEVQVSIAGVGRVDLVVDGWLIVECDSRAHHKGWRAQKRDRRRDLAAAALGYTTVRPIAEDILGDPERVLAAMKAILARRTARETVRNSSIVAPVRAISA